MSKRGLSLFSNFLVGKNEVGVAIDSARSKLRKFQNQSKKAGGAGGIFKGVLGAQAVSKGISLATLGIGAATREMLGFDHAVTAAGAKFGPAFARGTANFKALGMVARGVGATTEFSATQAANGLDFLAKAGFSAKQSMALLPGVVDLATGSQTDLARASDIASDTLGAFGLMTKDTAQLGINFTRVMDRMAKTATTSNTDLETMFESVQKGGPDFIAAGQSMETFLALTGKLANAGKKGSESGTALRNMALRLAKPTGEAGDVMDQLGIKTQDSEGNFIDFIDILGQFQTATATMGTAQRTAALSTIFGARAVTSVNILLKEGSKELENYRDKLEDSDGAARALAATMRTSITNQLKKAQSSAIELGLKFFDLFGPKIQSAIGSLQGFLDGLNNNFKDIADTINSVGQFFRDYATTIKVVTGALVLYKGVQIGANIVAAAQIGILGLQIKALTAYEIVTKGVAIATKAFTAAQFILNVAMAANPLGLAIVGVTAFIGVLTALELKFGVVSKAWRGIKGAFGFGDSDVDVNSTITSTPDVNSPFAFQAQAQGQGLMRSEHLERKESFMQMIPPEGWGVEKVPNVGVMSTLPLGDSP